MVKSTADGQKVARSAKQYSAVASRYAAPLASKKQPPGIGNEPQAGQSNMTKLPFITGALLLPPSLHSTVVDVIH